MAVAGHSGLERHAARTNGAARGFSQFLAGRGARLLALAAPVLELLLAAAIGFVVLLTVFALFAPLPTPERLPEAPSLNAVAAPVEGVNNPFRIAETANAAPPEEGPDLAETKLDLTLHGTWVDEGAGAAIIKTPDGEQARFSVGDEIWNGVRLDQVYRDQVVIISGGARESLRLVNRDFPAANRDRAAPKAASPEAGASLPGFPLGDAIRIVPQGGGVDGLELRLEPGPNSRRFAAMGLRPGDLLIAVDNRPLGPEIAQEAQRLRELAGRSAISIVVERDGVALPIEIDLAAEEGTEPNDG